MNLITIIWDGIRRRKIRSILSILGIAIAAASLFSLISLRDGYQAGMQVELDNMGAQVVAVAKGCPYEAIAIIMMGGQVPATLPEEAVEDIRSVPNVNFASPNVYGAYHYLGLSHPIIGITEDELKLKSWWEIQGRFPENFGEVVLGSKEAEAFAENSSEFHEIGDSITVSVGDRDVPLTVVGILESTGSKDDYTTFTTMETAQKLFDLNGRVVAVNIQIDDIGMMPETIENLEMIPDVQAVTVAQVMGTIQNLISTGESMLFMVMLVALVIGGLGTMNTMLMSVFERTREIGLMKAIGASSGQVFNLFLLEGITICLAGSLIGVAVGSSAALMGDVILNQFVSVMPTQSVGQISWYAVAAAVFFPLTVGIISTIYPALRAAGLSPIEALRNE